MKTPLSLLPDLPTLTARLTAALNGECASGPLTVLDADAKTRLLAEIINHESTHGRCTQTFIKKVRKQARPRPA